MKLTIIIVRTLALMGVAFTGSMLLDLPYIYSNWLRYLIITLLLIFILVLALYWFIYSIRRL